MWIPLVHCVLPKKLLKWATPHCSRAAKFKAKHSGAPRTGHKGQAIPTSNAPTTGPTPTVFSRQRYYLHSTATLWLVLTFALHGLGGRLGFGLGRVWSQLIVLIVGNFPPSTVTARSAFLMNDIRMKALYRSTRLTKNTSAKHKKLTNCASHSLSGSSGSLSGNSGIGAKRSAAPLTAALTASASASTTAAASNYAKNFKNNHRTYNNSSKSNKVFLHYTPRDPRLRILHKQTTINKHYANDDQRAGISVSGCVSVSGSANASELKIIEDLCHYGELIGGGDSGDSIHCGNFGDKFKRDYAKCGAHLKATEQTITLQSDRDIRILGTGQRKDNRLRYFAGAALGLDHTLLVTSRAGLLV